MFGGKAQLYLYSVYIIDAANKATNKKPKLSLLLVFQPQHVETAKILVTEGGAEVDFRTLQVRKHTPIVVSKMSKLIKTFNR